MKTACLIVAACAFVSALFFLIVWEPVFAAVNALVGALNLMVAKDVGWLS